MQNEKVWFITGAGRGMGLEITKAALAAGHKVVATGRSTNKLAKVFGHIKDLLIMKVDVLKVHDAEAVVKSAVERYGAVLVTLLTFMVLSVSDGNAQKPENTREDHHKNQVIRLAKLQIDSAQLERYKAALMEEIETSVRVEPGVLSLYAVSENDNPTHITIFEIYANEDAYNAHRETPHFKKYKSSTREMVKSLELIEVVPIVLAAKEN